MVMKSKDEKFEAYLKRTKLRIKMSEKIKVCTIVRLELIVAHSLGTSRNKMKIEYLN